MTSLSSILKLLIKVKIFFYITLAFNISIIVLYNPPLKYVSKVEYCELSKIDIILDKSYEFWGFYSKICLSLSLINLTTISDLRISIDLLWLILIRRIKTVFGLIEWRDMSF